MFKNGLLIIFFILLFELSIYLWHSIGTHTNLLGNVFIKSHLNHHNGNDIFAINDFELAIFPLIINLCIIYYLYIKNIFIQSKNVCLLLCIISISLLFITYYFHKSYHIPKHWLNKYKFFKNGKKLHLVHHQDMTKNFGLLSYIFDEYFNTIKYKDKNPLKKCKTIYI